VLNGFWLEEHAPVETPGFAAALTCGLVRFAEFLGARRLNCTILEPLTLREQMQEHIGAVLEKADSLQINASP